MAVINKPETGNRKKGRDRRKAVKRRIALFFIFFFVFFEPSTMPDIYLAVAQEKEAARPRRIRTEEEPLADKEPIVVNGERVEYLYEEKKVVGVNNVVITYKKVKIECDRIVVYMDTKEALAEGHVTMTQDGSRFFGEKVHYNFETEKGTIIKAAAMTDPWYGRGQTAAKVGKKEYIIERGYITTCELPHPHYRIQARRVKLFISDRIEAYNVLFFIGDIPVFYIPFYVHPLDEKRPRVTIIPGRNSRWGYYLLTAWRYYLHEWSRGYIHFDWRQKKGVAEGLDYKYKWGYFGKGLARFYYTKEDHTVTREESETGQGVGDNRWRAQLRHKWNIDGSTTFTGEFNRLSDKLFIKDYFFLDEYESESEPPTYVSIIRARPNYNLSFYVNRRIQDFFTVLEKLPEAKLDIKSQRIRETNFYYKSTTTLAMLQKKYDKSLFSPTMKAERFDTGHEFSYLMNLFGFLTVNPYVGARETWYSEDAAGEKDLLRHVYTVGTKLSTKFYRVFPFETDILALDINDLRHVITPSIDYSYTPTPNIKPEGLKQFEDVDAIGHYNGAALSLVNRLQTKRGEIVTETVDLARLTTSTVLYLRPEDRDYRDSTSDDFVGDVDWRLELTPYEWLSIQGDATYATKRNREDGIEDLNMYMAAEKKDAWRLGFGYKFEQGYDAGGRVDPELSSEQITTDTSYRFSPKWKFTTYHRFKKNPHIGSYDLEEQSYIVERDLHCWLAQLYYQVKKVEGREVEEDHRVWLVMTLKVFPEVPFKMFAASYTTSQNRLEEKEKESERASKTLPVIW